MCQWSQDREGKRDSNIPRHQSYVMCICIFSGVQCQVSGLGVRCHLSSVRCQVSSLWCQVSPVNYHPSEKAKARATDPPSSQVSCVTCLVSGIMHQVSCVRCQVSGVTCHVSCVRCHMSQIMCHMSFIVFSQHTNIQNFVKYVTRVTHAVCGLQHMVVIFQNFGNFGSFHVFHDFFTDSPCPTPSHQLLFS